VLATGKMQTKMSPVLVSAAVLLALIIAVYIGRLVHRFLSADHLTSDTRDTVKLAMGLVGTMAALLLGLLVSSAKGSYDSDRSQVIQMAAKVSFLDRVFELYGPEAAEARAQFHATVEESILRLWPNETRERAELKPLRAKGDPVYFAIEALVPKNDLQQKIKTAAESTAIDLAQQRALLYAQSETSISLPMLIVVVCWLIVIFISFSLLAPRNMIATFALLASTVAVSGAIFLILELDHPFDGLIRIPNQQMVSALNQLPK
jgi:hypothetical protein